MIHWSRGGPQTSKARRGTVWLSPPGVQEGWIDIAEDMTGILHIYLPLSHFSPGNFDISFDQAAVGALSYERAFEDPLLAEIGFAIASELQSETSAGGLLIGALASSLAARLVQKYVTASPAQSFPRHTVQGLDWRRLLRVLDYIEANLEGDLSIERMAAIIPFCTSVPASSRTISSSLCQRQAPRARESLIDARRSAIGRHSALAQLFQPGQFHKGIPASNRSGARSISSGVWIATTGTGTD
jgi:hypothetical protein